MKIKLSNHLRVCRFHIFGTILMFLCLLFFRFEEDMILVFLCFWILYTIPALYLHIEYYLANTGKEIEVNDSGITIEREGIKLHYASNSILKIVLYKSASLDRGGIQLTPVEGYYYARILIKSGEEIIITCLMTQKLEEELRKLRGIPTERKNRLFCTLSWG